ncbi:MAG TPA: hypothetical protein VH833_10410 [Gemmatimonadales bacterium]
MVPKPQGEKERDWDRELAEVDRLLNQLPTHQAEQAAAAAKRAAAPPSAPASSQPTSRAGTWARVGLGLLIGIGMTQWPYTHGCGLKLFIYLGGVFTVIVAGVWSGLSSWKRQMGVAHILSQGLVIWGLVLAAREVLPRIGYAKEVATWFCP